MAFPLFPKKHFLIILSKLGEADVTLWVVSLSAI